jgi:ABC-type molybdate transport system ATPase subunit
MKNVDMKLDGDILTIKVDVTKEFGPSSSGKTIIIASTEGNISIPEKDEIKIGLNVYKKKPAAA